MPHPEILAPPANENDSDPAPSRLYLMLESVSKALGMCGHGKEGNRWVRFAEKFFIDCPCCLFWRGVTVGVVAGFLLALAGLAIGMALVAYNVVEF